MTDTYLTIDELTKLIENGGLEVYGICDKFQERYHIAKADRKLQILPEVDIYVGWTREKRNLYIKSSAIVKPPEYGVNAGYVLTPSPLKNRIVAYNIGDQQWHIVEVRSS